MLPFLRYCLESRVRKVSMLCEFRAVMRIPFEMKFSMEVARPWYRVIQTKAALIASLNLSIIRRSLNKKSSRSKSRIGLRTGRLLRFQRNSTATSDGGAQKLENDLWHDSESITTKVCSQNSRKWKAIFESHVKTFIKAAD